jgi:phosphatidylserine/phosphatidylglycerophosphate/cardiolipin synthase-like enzyme
MNNISAITRSHIVVSKDMVMASGERMAVPENATVDQWFRGADNLQEHALYVLGKCKKTLLVEMYSFTDKKLCDAIIAAKTNGAKVRVYLDRSNAAKNGVQARRLVAAGVETRISSNPAISHNKVAVIDGKTVLTGSFNWTTAAETKNDENLVCIESASAAKQYTTEFEILWPKFNQEKTDDLKTPATTSTPKPKRTHKPKKG